MICPKCGFEQPESPECLRCGIIISRYRGPVLGAAPPPAALPLTADPGFSATATDRPPVSESRGSFSSAPAPALATAGAGTIYEGPMAVPGVPTFGTAAGPRYQRTFEVGKILGETFSIYFSNFVPFLILAALAYLPVLVFSAWQSTLQTGLLVAFAQLLSVLIKLVCQPMATAAVTYGVFNQLRGLNLTVGDCLRAGLAVLPPMVGLALYQGILVGLGLLVCLIPGIMLAVQWAVAIPAAVEERPGVTGAVKRSTYLTDGFRWNVFGVLLVLGVLEIGLSLVLALVVGRDPAASGKLSLLTNLVEIPTVGLSATATAVMYYRLRSIKESIDVDQIASVFA